jgi:hypothetical protein
MLPEPAFQRLRELTLSSNRSPTERSFLTTGFEPDLRETTS